MVVAPSRANASAMACPMPRHEPVTSATLSFRRFMGVLLSSWGCGEDSVSRAGGVAVTCVTVRQQCVNVRHLAAGVADGHRLAAVRRITAAVNRFQETP